MRKTDFPKTTAKLISAFVFATRIVQSLYFLNSKFQVSSPLLWPYSSVCVRPGRKPRRPVFSERGSNYSGHHLMNYCWNFVWELSVRDVFCQKWYSNAEAMSWKFSVTEYRHKQEDNDIIKWKISFTIIRNGYILRNSQPKKCLPRCTLLSRVD